MKCVKCGTDNPESAAFCNACGTRLTIPVENGSESVYASQTEATGSTPNPTSSSTGTTPSVDRIIWKVLCMVAGLIGIVFSGYTIYDDMNAFFGYTYTAPFSEHETTILAVLIVSIIVFLIGCSISSHSKNDN